MRIDAQTMYFRELNEIIASSRDREIQIDHVGGQRYIGTALEGYRITINGTPGNGLAAYMNRSTVTVNGSAQDAAGDTMNSGKIIVHGRCGDACGYAMRGGEIYIRESTGYRTGIHMKQYRDMSPVIVVGETAGDFLGEYLAGGTILVLGLHSGGKIPVGSFCGTGMHGGVIYLRSENAPDDLPGQVNAEPAAEADKAVIRGLAQKFCGYFGGDPEDIMNSGFVRLTPNSRNPYHQLYTNNW